VFLLAFKVTQVMSQACPDCRFWRIAQVALLGTACGQCARRQAVLAVGAAHRTSRRY